MSRLEKKCFVGSATFHAALLLVFLFGSAFLSSNPKPQGVQVITLMSIPTDKLISTGGSRSGSPTPAPPPPAIETPKPPPPSVETPKPEPPKPEPAKPVEAEKPREAIKPKEIAKPKPIERDVPKEHGDFALKKPNRKTTEKPRETDSSDAPVRQISTRVVKRTNDLARAEHERQARIEREAREAREKADREYRKQLEVANRQHQALVGAVEGLVHGVAQSLGSRTVVQPLGDGDLVAYAHYGSQVGEYYKQAVYAARPQSDEDAVAVIRVVVARNGAVRDADWVRKTGNVVLDKAVERAMRNVRVLPAFPREATDSERTFNINIGFEAKRASA